MYKLTDLVYDALKLPPLKNWDGKMICGPSNYDNVFLANNMKGHLRCYSFTLLDSGWLKVLFNQQEITLQKNDLYVFTPGIVGSVIDASEDYHGLCLIVEESFTFESPVVQNLIKAAYFPIARLHEPKITLSETEAEHLRGLMQLCHDRIHSTHTFKSDSLRLIYELFILDLIDIQRKSIEYHPISGQAKHLFIAFIQLVPQHYIVHHDIGFYASMLHITPTYLSRIVKRISGRTVMDYINHMLLMEASGLLLFTTQSIAQIASILHFADQASFCKFFLRMKGMTPTDYRTKK